MPPLHSTGAATNTAARRRRGLCSLRVPSTTGGGMRAVRANRPGGPPVPFGPSLRRLCRVCAGLPGLPSLRPPGSTVGRRAARMHDLRQQRAGGGAGVQRLRPDSRCGSLEQDGSPLRGLRAASAGLRRVRAEPAPTLAARRRSPSLPTMRSAGPELPAAVSTLRSDRPSRPLEPERPGLPRMHAGTPGLLGVWTRQSSGPRPDRRPAVVRAMCPRRPDRVAAVQSVRPAGAGSPLEPLRASLCHLPAYTGVLHRLPAATRPSPRLPRQHVPVPQLQPRPSRDVEDLSDVWHGSPRRRVDPRRLAVSGMPA